MAKEQKADNNMAVQERQYIYKYAIIYKYMNLLVQTFPIYQPTLEFAEKDTIM